MSNQYYCLRCHQGVLPPDENEKISCLTCGEGSQVRKLVPVDEKQPMSPGQFIVWFIGILSIGWFVGTWVLAPFLIGVFETMGK